MELLSYINSSFGIFGTLNFNSEELSKLMKSLKDKPIILGERIPPPYFDLNDTVSVDTTIYGERNRNRVILDEVAYPNHDVTRTVRIGDVPDNLLYLDNGSALTLGQPLDYITTSISVPRDSS